jgi:hypothetical protein
MASLALSSSAFAAECDGADLLANDVLTLHNHVACASYPDGVDATFTGLWPRNNPVWQYKRGQRVKDGEALEGCEVHYNLSKKLYDVAVTNPNKKGGNKEGLRGAYAALRDGKLQAAYDNLEAFITMADNATLNPAFDPNLWAAAAKRDEWTGIAEDIQDDIMCLMTQ